MVARVFIGSVLLLACFGCTSQQSDNITSIPDKDEKSVTITIESDKEVGDIYNFWSTSVTTCEYIFNHPLDAAAIKREAPFVKYYNFVRFLGGRHDDKYEFFKGISEDGGAICDFTDGVNFLKPIIEGGYTPRIVLDNIPKGLQSEGTGLNKYGNTSPAKDLIAWHSYVKQFIQALIDEFGKEEVSKWRFRVGTEPDLYPGHWTGTPQQWFQHYDWTVDAVTRVIPEADIGPGNILCPSGYNPGKWGLDIIDHCAKGRNYVTGEVGTRMCFFSYSCYGNIDEPLDAFEYNYNLIKYRLGEYPNLKDTPVEIHEFGAALDTDGLMYGGDATEWAASWMAAVSDKIYKLGIPEVYQWSTTTEGIANPRTHVLELLEKMKGGRRLNVTGNLPKRLINIGCLAGYRNEGYDLLIYKHEPQREDRGKAKIAVSIKGDNLKGSDWKLVDGYIIDEDHSGYHRVLIEDLKKAGIEPEGIIYDARVLKGYSQAGHDYLYDNYAKYKRLSELDKLESLPALTFSNDNVLNFDVDLNSHAVIYLRLEKKDKDAI